MWAKRMLRQALHRQLTIAPMTAMMTALQAVITALRR